MGKLGYCMRARETLVHSDAYADEVYRDDGTDMRVLGAIASARPDIFGLDAVGL